ncbi:hypothetical protein JOE44_000512 [Chryseobacterium sp. PvR013]|uniref:hypothetical protein n=1 Tax=Chryseobacterium sp. PvR013 TaxID=2806595 RepID=UPI001AE2083C|nr:hypothetical protein [Chryseobacterium sp. PvR013]MBP1163628.1 hypothetical protein [Chryseobacterium sp. PvR013]
MSPEEFVKNFYVEKQNILHSCFNSQSEYKSITSIKIEELNLDEIQTEKLKKIVSGLLTDTFYTILLGLDGYASIGTIQESFKIYDEENNLISDDGDLEGYAYEYFHRE